MLRRVALFLFAALAAGCDSGGDDEDDATSIDGSRGTTNGTIRLGIDPSMPRAAVYSFFDGRFVGAEEARLRFEAEGSALRPQQRHRQRPGPGLRRH